MRRRGTHARGPRMGLGASCNGNKRFTDLLAGRGNSGTRQGWAALRREGQRKG